MAHYTTGDYRTYLNHPIFSIARRLAKQKTNGKCSVCGDKATEVHHFLGKKGEPKSYSYPPWGAFDVPANLQPICHPCHCKIEGKVK